MLSARAPPCLLSCFFLSRYTAKAKPQRQNSVNVTVVITSSPITCTRFLILGAPNNSWAEALVSCDLVLYLKDPEQL